MSLPLSMTSTIQRDDILEIKMYKTLKVYLLVGTDGSELVIKIDAVDAPQIKSAGVAVKAVDPAVKMKLLTPSERFELQQYCQTFEEIDAYFESIDLALPPHLRSQKDAVEKLKESLTFREPFAKMPKQTIHHLEDAAEKRGQGNKDVVRLFVGTLKDDGGLEMLGKVVAGDLFNGNCDRFFPGTNRPLSFGPFTVTLKALVNPGNAMIIATQAGGFTPTMLDYVDPSSQYKNIDAPLNETPPDKMWPGRTLVDRKARRAFAQDIVDDLENLLHPKKSWFSMKTKLGRNAVSRLDAGMVEGAALIKRRLEAKYGPNRWTQGATERYRLICTVR